MSSFKKTWGPLWGSVKSHQWLIIGMCAFSVLCLGWYGFNVLRRPGGAGYFAWYDNLYLAFQLFTMNSGNVQNAGLSLNIARFVAPFVLAVASIKTIFLLLREEVNSMALSLIYRKHVVICGLGQKGMVLFRDYKEEKKRIVIIESDEGNDNMSTCRQKGAIVLVGNADDPFLLEKAQVQRASHVFAVTGNDSTNIRIAVECKKLVSSQKPARQVECFAHVYDLRLRNIFDQDELFTRSDPFFNARMFNIYDDGARLLLNEYPPDAVGASAECIQLKGMEDGVIELLIVGFGWAGESILKQALRVGHYSPDRKLIVRIVDQQAEQKKGRFLSSYADCVTKNGSYHSFLNIDIFFHSADVESVSFLEGFGLSSQYTPSVIYICLGDDNLSVSTAVRLRALYEYEGPGIIVCLKQEIPHLFKSEKFQTTYKNIHPFSMVEYGCSLHIKTERELDSLAKVVHAQYLRDALCFDEENGKDFLKGDGSHDIDAGKVRALAQSINEQGYEGITISSRDVHDNESLEGWIAEINDKILRCPSFYSKWHAARGHKTGAPTLESGLDKIVEELKERACCRKKWCAGLDPKEQALIVFLNFSLLLDSHIEQCPDKLSINENLRLWEYITEEMKDSSRYQADHIPVKLRSIGFSLNDTLSEQGQTKIEAALKSSGNGLLGSDEENTNRKVLREAEHNRWMAERFLAGWRKGVVLDSTHRLNPNLIPYANLDEAARVLDDGAVNNILQIIHLPVWKQYWEKLRSASAGTSRPE